MYVAWCSRTQSWGMYVPKDRDDCRGFRAAGYFEEKTAAQHCLAAFEEAEHARRLEFLKRAGYALGSLGADPDSFVVEYGGRLP